eukprot:67051-Chlamydomonas_euryale.AAC.1
MQGGAGGGGHKKCPLKRRRHPERPCATTSSSAQGIVKRSVSPCVPSVPSVKALLRREAVAKQGSTLFLPLPASLPAGCQDPRYLEPFKGHLLGLDVAVEL